MRRWLLTLLLVLLPLQSVWAEAAAYCRHERGAANGLSMLSAERHWGHHEHQHGSAAPAADADDASALLAGADVDCNVCHAGGAVAVPLWQPAPALHGVGSHPLRHTPTLPTRALAPPDKPNWAAAA